MNFSDLSVTVKTCVYDSRKEGEFALFGNPELNRFVYARLIPPRQGLSLLYQWVEFCFADEEGYPDDQTYCKPLGEFLIGLTMHLITQSD